MLCTYCNRTNHTVDNCYFKHGFPPGYRTKNQSTALQIGSAQPYQTSKFDTHSGSAKAPSNDSSFSITREDYQHLLPLLHASKSDPGSTVNTLSKPPITETAPHVISSITNLRDMFQ